MVFTYSYNMYINEEERKTRKKKYKALSKIVVRQFTRMEKWSPSIIHKWHSTKRKKAQIFSSHILNIEHNNRTDPLSRRSIVDYLKILYIRTVVSYDIVFF